LKCVKFPMETSSLFQGINVIFATVAEDIHDVGKNVTISLYNITTLYCKIW
jgi:methanogenic corrinoid protein MtbC1